MSKTGLFLAGGGARGAFQAGVIKAIHAILKTPAVPFELISGASAGAGNACILAQNADNFKKAVKELEDLWCNIKSNNMYNANNLDITKSLLRNMGIMFVEQHHSGFLLDSDPLKKLLGEHINFKKISKNIAEKKIKMLEVICTCYDTQRNYSFCQQNDPDFSHWQHYKHMSVTSDIHLNHVLASSALPLFFAPVKIEDKYYGDGSMGLVSPLRGLIHTKADKILVVSNRNAMTTDDKPMQTRIGFSHILGTMLNSLFQDNLDREIEIVNHLNELSGMVSSWNRKNSPWKSIKTLHIRPNIDLAKIALKYQDHLPSGLKVLMSIFGGGAQSGDLVSFLLFESPYTEEIFQLGYDSTLEISEDVLEFFDN
jgi:NTE family protein